MNLRHGTNILITLWSRVPDSPGGYISTQLVATNCSIYTLQKPVPSQVIMAAARTRVKEKKDQRTRGAHGATALNNINSNKLDSSDSDGSTCTIVAQDELNVE